MAKQRVLIVDGDAETRSQLSTLVGELSSREGIEIELREARDGGEALELARKQAPDLVLMEILIEGPHGLQVLRQLRKDKAEGEGPQVVLVTDMAAEIDRYWSLRNGAAAFVKKPWDEDDLRKTLLRVLRP